MKLRNVRLQTSSWNMVLDRHDLGQAFFWAGGFVEGAFGLVGTTKPNVLTPRTVVVSGSALHCLAPCDCIETYANHLGFGHGNNSAQLWYLHALLQSDGGSCTQEAPQCLV